MTYSKLMCVQVTAAAASSPLLSPSPLLLLLILLPETQFTVYVCSVLASRLKYIMHWQVCNF